MDPTIIASIIIAAGSVIAAFLIWLLGKGKSPKSFPERKDAKHSMFGDIEKAHELVFLGISNTSLYDYFWDVINNAKMKEKFLPLETIDIFFARDDVGKSWEGDQFGENIVNTAHKISYLFTMKSLRSTIPSFKRLSFHQNSLVSYYGGSLFKLSQDRNKDYFSVIYVVHYMPLLDADTKTSYTLRLTKGHKDPQNPHGRYLQSYKYIKDKANLLCNFESGKNMWDWSVEEWDKFEKNYPIYSKVMENLINFGEISPHHTVLELGCGTGRVSKSLADHLKEKGALFLLDSSPQMVMKAKELFNNYRNVKIIVADAKRPLYGAFRNKKFDRILTHFSFQHFINGSCSIQLFAKNWEKYLEKDGEILIAIHNSFIECNSPPGFENWVDPLREKIMKIAFQKGFTVKRDLHRKFTIDEIKRAFKDAGFYLKNSESKIYQRTMEDRIAMWKTPAVLDSLLDIKQIDPKECCELLENVLLDINVEETMPTTIVFLSFSLHEQTSPNSG